MKDELLSDDLRFENNKTSTDKQLEDNKSPDYNTLNESVWTTLQRDLVRIKNKLFVVIVPFTSKEKEKELRHWDLWGPFLFCLLFGM